MGVVWTPCQLLRRKKKCYEIKKRRGQKILRQKYMTAKLSHDQKTSVVAVRKFFFRISQYTVAHFSRLSQEPFTFMHKVFADYTNRNTILFCERAITISLHVYNIPLISSRNRTVISGSRSTTRLQYPIKRNVFNFMVCSIPPQL